LFAYQELIIAGGFNSGPVDVLEMYSIASNKWRSGTFIIICKEEQNSILKVQKLDQL
jgi:hypothetical protein